MMLDIRNAALALGGELSGNQIRCPGPGHSAQDRSLVVTFDPKAPDGFFLHSFAKDDTNICRDHVREKVGLPKFKSNGNGKPRISEDVIAKAMAMAVAAPVAKPSGTIVAKYQYTDSDGTL